MVFSSTVFLFLFLPIVILVYFTVPRRLRNALLLVSSVIFYMWGEYKFVGMLFTIVLIDFVAGLVISGGWRGGPIAELTPGGGLEPGSKSRGSCSALT